MSKVYSRTRFVFDIPDFGSKAMVNVFSHKGQAGVIGLEVQFGRDGGRVCAHSYIHL